jgi:hypothetical protein
MGIIKTAMMVGGGVYAVNKIAKWVTPPILSFVHQRASPYSICYRTAGIHSQGHPSNNGKHDARGYMGAPQDCQGSQALPPVQPQISSRDFDDSKRASYPPPQAYYLTNDNASAPLPQRYSVIHNNDAMSGSQRGYPDEAFDGRRTLMPPQYVNQQQMDFMAPQDRSYENQDYENQGRSPSPLPALAGKAMDYAMNKAGGTSGKSGSGKGSDILAGLFSKWRYAQAERHMVPGIECIRYRVWLLEL